MSGTSTPSTGCAQGRPILRAEIIRLHPCARSGQVALLTAPDLGGTARQGRNGSKVTFVVDDRRTARAAAVLKDSYPVRWAGRQAVVVLPEHIGQANAGQVSEELLSVINRGADALIVDMTGTISCDYTGADALLRARQRTVSSGTEIRLAVTDGIVRRALSLSGLDRMISIYPSLEAAVAADAPATPDGTADAPDGTAGPAITPEVRRRLLDALSRAELSLLAALESSGDAARPRIAEALRHLTDGIRDITLAAHRQGTASPDAPPEGTQAASRPQAGTE